MSEVSEVRICSVAIPDNLNPNKVKDLIHLEASRYQATAIPNSLIFLVVAMTQTLRDRAAKSLYCLDSILVKRHENIENVVFVTCPAGCNAAQLEAIVRETAKDLHPNFADESLLNSGTIVVSEDQRVDKYVTLNLSGATSSSLMSELARALDEVETDFAGRTEVACVTLLIHKDIHAECELKFNAFFSAVEYKNIASVGVKLVDAHLNAAAMLSVLGLEL